MTREERLLEDDVELAAAAVFLAFHEDEGVVEPMPEDVKRRVLAAARSHMQRQTRRSMLNTRYLGWYAAAAMLLLSLWAPWSSKPGVPATSPTLAAQRERLILQAADVIQVAWATPGFAEYSGVRGDVVWSGREQAGFMLLRGLPPNRGTVEQYQLWIVDPSRDEHPIDGGVFDIPAGVDEIILPIAAKLQVASPRAFAITLEQPGGVVVSDGPLLVVAPVQG